MASMELDAGGDAMNPQTVRPTSSTYRLLLLAILLVAFGLRCGGLDTQELRGDEAFGYFFSLPALNEIVEQTLDLSEPHPVASYWLQHLWLALAGHSEFALRFTGVWWSVLAVALLVPVAAKLALPNVSVIVAATLMALSPYTIWHAQDARMYSMSLALTLLSTLLAAAWWQGQTRREKFWYMLGYLIVTWLALHTHYFSLYVVAAQHIAILGWAIVERAWRKLLIWWGIGGLLLLLWLPWLLASSSILLDYHGNGDSPGLLDALIRAHSAFGVGETMAGAGQVGWALSTLAAMGLGALALWRRQREGGRAAVWFLLVYWLTPLAATWLSAQSRPIFNERYLVAAVPPVYLLMAAAVGGQRRDDGARWWLWLGRVVVALVMVGMLLGLVRQVSDPLYSKTRGWRELAAAFEPLAAGIGPQQMRLVQNYPDPTLWYYYQGDVPHLVLPPSPNDQARSVEEVGRLVADGVTRVVLVEQPAASWDANGIARDTLGTEYSLGATTTVAQWPLSIWLRPPSELEPTQVIYEGGLQLKGMHFTPTAAPGGVIEVYLRWSGDEESVGAQEAVSVQLLNDAGELVAQSDRPLAMASVTTADVEAYAILLPTTLAGGEYQLSVIVYDPSRADAPRRLTVEGADRHTLGSVTIVETPQ